MSVPQSVMEREALTRALRGDFSLLNQIERAAAIRNHLRPHTSDGVDRDRYSKYVIEREIKSSMGKLIGYRWGVRGTPECNECSGSGEVVYRGAAKNFTITCPECEGEDLASWASPFLVTDLMGEIIQDTEIPELSPETENAPR